MLAQRTRLAPKRVFNLTKIYLGPARKPHYFEKCLGFSGDYSYRNNHLDAARGVISLCTWRIHFILSVSLLP